MSLDYSTLALVAGIGTCIGVGKLLMQGVPLKPGIVLGHALVTSGFSLSGLALLAFLPGLVFEAKVGIAALLASLGLVGVEKLANRVFNSPSSPQ